jgi:hypothetical protein
VPALPNNLIAGDVVEIHSARYERPTLTWLDTDPADIWWELLTVYLQWPAERIGRGDMGHGARAGLPPRVEDIEPGDDDAQAKRLVTLQLKGGDGESGADLINQLSFLLGGATVDIGGQIVFRQIYPLRKRDGRHHGRAGSGRRHVRRAQHDRSPDTDGARATHLAARVHLRRRHDRRKRCDAGRRADDGRGRPSTR